MAELPGLTQEPHDAGYERLKQAYLSLQQQFAATSEILTALGRAGADPSAILDTIVERARSLCGADASQLYLLEDGVFQVSRMSGGTPREYTEDFNEPPSTVSKGRGSPVGRFALTRRSEQIEDVLADPEYQ